MPEPIKFQFTLARALDAERDLDLQISALESRIDKVVKAIEVSGVPVVGAILQLTHKEEELARIAEGLKLIGTAAEKLDALKERKKIFDLVNKEPDWMQWAFGDFSSELEEFVSGVTTLKD